MSLFQPNAKAQQHLSSPKKRQGWFHALRLHLGVENRSTVSTVVYALFGVWVITFGLITILFLMPVSWLSFVDQSPALLNTTATGHDDLVFYSKKAFISHFSNQYPVEELEPVYDQLAAPNSAPIRVRKRTDATKRSSFSDAFDIRPVSDN